MSSELESDVCCRLQVNATGVTAGPAESNGRLLLGICRDSLHVTCGLTACTPGSAPGPTLGNEYGKTLLYFFYYVVLRPQNGDPIVTIDSVTSLNPMYIRYNARFRTRLVIAGAVNSIPEAKVNG